MKSLVKQYKINEAYSLQEYEGKIRDAIISEIAELNKSAILICLLLHKFSFCITTRTIQDHNLNCTISLIYYNRDSGKPDEVSSKNDDWVGPDAVDGATARDKVFVYVPIDLDTVPFATERLNEFCHDDIYEGCSEDIAITSTMMYTNNYESIAPSLKRLRQQYDSNVQAFIDSLPNECANAKKTLRIDINYVLKTVKHELTHVLDQFTASQVNHFTGIGIDNVDKHGLDLALNILYSLWSRTEFNAFTQTYGADTDRKRDIVRSKFINKVSMQYLARPCSDGGYIDLKDFLNGTDASLDELASPEYDEEFWDAIRCIVIEGSKENSAKERFDKMSPIRFRNYFIHTTERLIEKFKYKLVKNIASQNTYNRDISNIAADILDAVNKSISDYNTGDLIELSFHFDQYFKKKDLSCKVLAEFETLYARENLSSNDAASGNTICHIFINTLNIRYDLTPVQLFGSSNNSYVELYREMITKQRKNTIKTLCLNLAEDLYNRLNRIVK